MSKPKRLKHIPGHKYRICRKCDYEYNVSIFDDSGKIYLCPKCRGRNKKNVGINSIGVQNAVLQKQRKQ